MCKLGTGRTRSRNHTSGPASLFCSVCILLLGWPTQPTAEVSSLSWTVEYQDENEWLFTTPGGLKTDYQVRLTEDGKVLSARYPGGRQTQLAFNKRGQLANAWNEQSRFSVTYSNTGFPQRIDNADRHQLALSYDIEGRLTSLWVADMLLKSIDRDYLGRPSRISTPVGDIIYRYDRAQNLITRTLPIGIRTAWQFNDEGLLSSILHTDPENYVLARFDYEYRADRLIGQITEYTQETGEIVCHYGYDEMSRIFGRDCSNGDAERIEYDQSGNVISRLNTADERVAFQSGVAGVLGGHSDGPVEVDARGHVRKMPGRNGPIELEYSETGAISSINSHVNFAYDPLGRLLERTENGNSTEFLPDPFSETWQPLWSKDQEGSIHLWIWDGYTPLVEIVDGVPIFRLEDHIGSPRVILDQSGKPTMWPRYGLFGEPKDRNDFAPGFAGHFWEPSAEGYLTPARLYHPASARFLQPDPIQRVPDASRFSHTLYAYAGGDPLNYVDRDGNNALLFQDYESRPISILSPFDTQFQDVEKMRRAVAIVYEYVTNGKPVSSRGEMEHTLGRLRNIFFMLREFGQTKEFDGNALSSRLDQLIKRGVAGGVPFSQETRAHRLEMHRELYLQRDLPQLSRQEFQSVENAMQAALDAHTTSYIQASIKNDGYSFIKNNVIIPYLKITGQDPLHQSDVRHDLVDHFLSVGMRSKEDFGAVERAINQDWGQILSGSTKRRMDGFKFEPTMDMLFTPIQPSRGGSNLIDQIIERSFPGSDPMGPQSGPPTENPVSAGSDPRGATVKNLTEHLMRSHQAANEAISRYDIAGGSGRTASTTAKGYANEASYQALATYDDILAQTRPSRVGGVFLGGAGKALSRLGSISGMALDERTGKIALIGKAGELDMPDLPLSVVAEIFRAVYSEGAPWVTIDPDPVDPHGPVMHIKHDPATQGTYTGWVLAQTDRIMKAYMLSKDNETGQPITTKIAGYDEVQRAVFFEAERNAVSNWERFWLVPVVRIVEMNGGSDLGAIALDVTLKVKTQRMRWVNGELVDDTAVGSSAGAKAFSAWFTTNYDAVAAEVFMTPPEGAEEKEPVPIFLELQRIATISAIAEHLRDKGVPMPLWIRDMAARPVHMPLTTPSLTVAKTHASHPGVTAQIYGGVNLLPAKNDKAIQTETGEILGNGELLDAGDVKNARSELQEQISDLAEAIRKPEMDLATTPLGDAGSKGTILPGATSLSLGANQLSHADLSIYFGRGQTLELKRHYNSFFAPESPFGGAWTFDLPRLEFLKRPVTSDGKRTQYITVPHLTSDLGSVSALFDKTAFVEAYGGELVVAEGQSDIDGLVSGKDPVSGVTTWEVLFRGGSVWYFDEAGQLIQTEQKGVRRRFIYDERGQLRALVGMIGGTMLAEIRVEYDDTGRVRSAKAATSDALLGMVDPGAMELNYLYSETGTLSCVGASGCDRAYTMEDDLLVAITDSQGVVTEFVYDERALLTGLVRDGQLVDLQKVSHENAVRLTLSGDRSHTYDVALRPLVTTDGNRRSEWDYSNPSLITRTEYFASDRLITSTAHQNGAHRLSLDKGQTLEIEASRNQSSRILMNGSQIGEIDWRNTGAIVGTTIGKTHIAPRLDQNGLQTGVLVGQRTEDDQMTLWHEEQWDLFGRVTEIRDSSGRIDIFQFDAENRLGSMGYVAKDGALVGWQFVYDAKDELAQINSSWGKMLLTRHSNGTVKKLSEKRGDKTRITEFDDKGRILSVSDFFGNITRQKHADNQDHPLEIVFPDGTRIESMLSTNAEGRELSVTLQDERVRNTVFSDDSEVQYTWEHFE